MGDDDFTPPPPPEPGQQPQYPPQPQGPKEDPLKKMIKTTQRNYMLIFYLAAFLLLISVLLAAVTQLAEEPEPYSTDDYDDYDDYQDAVEAHQDFERNMYGGIILTRGLGALLIAFALIIGGIHDPNVSDLVKLGMFIGAGLVLGLMFG